MPGGRKIVGHPADDGCAALELALKGRRWIDLTVSSIRLTFAGPLDELPTAMTSPAFVYFLPGLLKMASEKVHGAKELAYSVLSRIADDVGSYPEDDFLEALSVEQRVCVFECLQLLFPEGYFRAKLKSARRRLGL